MSNFVPTFYGWVNAVSGHLCDAQGKDKLLSVSPWQLSKNRIVLTILNWSDEYSGSPLDYTWFAAIGQGLGRFFQTVTVSTPDMSSSSSSSLDSDSTGGTHYDDWYFSFDYTPNPECLKKDKIEIWLSDGDTRFIAFDFTIYYAKTIFGCNTDYYSSSSSSSSSYIELWSSSSSSSSSSSLSSYIENWSSSSSSSSFDDRFNFEYTTTGATTVNIELFNAVNISIEWGDGTNNVYNGATPIASHYYSDANIYKANMRGQCGKFVFGSNTELTKIYTIMGVNGITSFTATFQSCAGLTSIPSNLFDNLPLVEDFNNCFNSCPNLTSIPSKLFDKNTLATDFNSCFRSCPSITSIPFALFGNNILATDFSNCFLNNIGLTSIPLFLFNNNTLVESFTSTFQGCTGLTSIPSSLFDNCTLVTDFSGCFFGCNNVTAIPSGLFNKNTLVSSFASCLRNCTALTGSSRQLWLSHSSATGTQCYTGDVSLSDWDNIPESWGGPSVSSSSSSSSSYIEEWSSSSSSKSSQSLSESSFSSSSYSSSSKSSSSESSEFYPCSEYYNMEGCSDNTLNGRWTKQGVYYDYGFPHSYFTHDVSGKIAWWSYLAESYVESDTLGVLRPGSIYWSQYVKTYYPDYHRCPEGQWKDSWGEKDGWMYDDSDVSSSSSSYIDNWSSSSSSSSYVNNWSSSSSTSGPAVLRVSWFSTTGSPNVTGDYAEISSGVYKKMGAEYYIWLHPLYNFWIITNSPTSDAWIGWYNSPSDPVNTLYVPGSGSEIVSALFLM